MKKITKGNKAITLIALILTVVIMLILISITTYSGINIYKETKITKFITQMQLLQSKIDDLVATKTSEELNNMQLESVTTQAQQNAITFAFNNGEITTNEASAYKVFTKDNILNILDIEDIQNDIMVNFNTREIVSIAGIKYEGITYYTQYKLPNGQTIVNTTDTTRDLSFTLDLSIDGINSTVTAKEIKITNGTLSYKEENDSYWQTATNYTETGKTYNILISKSGNYTFRLQDNTDVEKSFTNDPILITLTNKPKINADMTSYNYDLSASEKWAYATDASGINYVWIPRFVFNENNDIKFIKGNSNIATDNTYINDNEWTVHSKFKNEDGTELTGIWVSVEALNQEGLNMIILLNDTNRTVLTEINI